MQVKREGTNEKFRDIISVRVNNGDDYMDLYDCEGLEFRDEKNIDWTALRHQYAGQFMSAYLKRQIDSIDDVDTFINNSVYLADRLIEKLKK